MPSTAVGREQCPVSRYGKGPLLTQEPVPERITGLVAIHQRVVTSTASIARNVESQRGSSGLTKRISGMSNVAASSLCAPLYYTIVCRCASQKCVKMS